MNCMKCGAEIPDGMAFCEDCLKEMDRYPVNPNTPVVLPYRKTTPVPGKAARKKVVSTETQIAILKHRVRLLTVLLVVVTILASLLVYPAVKFIMEDHFLPGQNYKSIVSVTSGTEETIAE